MEKGTQARYGAATGILAVIFLVVGYGIATSDIPKLDDPVLDWRRFFIDHQDRIQTGIIIASVGLFFFVWFLGSVRDAVAAAEGGTGRLASIAHGSGIIIVAVLVLGIGATGAAALHPQGVAPGVLRALSDLGAVSGGPAAGAFAAFFASIAVAGYRHGALPAPVAGISATAAIGQLFAFLVPATDSGAFAGDGALGLWVPFITFMIAILVLSGTLVRQSSA